MEKEPPERIKGTHISLEMVPIPINQTGKPQNSWDTGILLKMSCLGNGKQLALDKLMLWSCFKKLKSHG